MTALPWPTWDEWLADLDAETRRRAASLRDDFARRGADDPESWTRSEIGEDIAQMARFLFLTSMWRRMEGATDDALASPRARALVEAGGDRDELARLVRGAVYQLAFEVCYLVDEPAGTTWQEDGEWRSDIEPTDRRWQLLEVDADGEPTGRDVGGLHESLLETDPSGNEGGDWISW